MFDIIALYLTCNEKSLVVYDSFLQMPLHVTLTLLCSAKTVQRSIKQYFRERCKQFHQVLKIHITAYVHVFIERTAFESNN